MEGGVVSHPQDVFSHWRDGVKLVEQTERVREHQEEAMHLACMVGHAAEVTHTRFTELHWSLHEGDKKSAAVANLPHKSRARRQRPSDRPISNQVANMLTKVAEQLNQAQAEFIYRRELAAKCDDDAREGLGMTLEERVLDDIAHAVMPEGVDHSIAHDNAHFNGCHPHDHRPGSGPTSSSQPFAQPSAIPAVLADKRPKERWGHFASLANFAPRENVVIKLVQRAATPVEEVVDGDEEDSPKGPFEAGCSHAGSSWQRLMADKKREQYMQHLSQMVKQRQMDIERRQAAKTLQSAFKSFVARRRLEREERLAAEAAASQETDALALALAERNAEFEKHGEEQASDGDDHSGSWCSAGASDDESREDGEAPSSGLDAYLKAADAKWKKDCVRVFGDGEYAVQLENFIRLETLENQASLLRQLSSVHSIQSAAPGSAGLDAAFSMPTSLDLQPFEGSTGGSRLNTAGGPSEGPSWQGGLFGGLSPLPSGEFPPLTPGEEEEDSSVPRGFSLLPAVPSEGKAEGREGEEAEGEQGVAARAASAGQAEGEEVEMDNEVEARVAHDGQGAETAAATQEASDQDAETAASETEQSGRKATDEASQPYCSEEDREAAAATQAAVALATQEAKERVSAASSTNRIPIWKQQRSAAAKHAPSSSKGAKDGADGLLTQDAAMDALLARFASHLHGELSSDPLCIGGRGGAGAGGGPLCSGGERGGGGVGAALAVGRSVGGTAMARRRLARGRPSEAMRKLAEARVKWAAQACRPDPNFTVVVAGGAAPASPQFHIPVPVPSGIFPGGKSSSGSHSAVGERIAGPSAEEASVSRLQRSHTGAMLGVGTSVFAAAEVQGADDGDGEGGGDARRERGSGPVKIRLGGAITGASKKSRITSVLQARREAVSKARRQAEMEAHRLSELEPAPTPPQAGGLDASTLLSVQSRRLSQEVSSLHASPQALSARHRRNSTAMPAPLSARAPNAAWRLQSSGPSTGPAAFGSHIPQGGMPGMLVHGLQEANRQPSAALQPSFTLQTLPMAITRAASKATSPSQRNSDSEGTDALRPQPSGTARVAGGEEASISLVPRQLSGRLPRGLALPHPLPPTAPRGHRTGRRKSVGELPDQHHAQPPCLAPNPHPSAALHGALVPHQHSLGSQRHSRGSNGSSRLGNGYRNGSMASNGDSSNGGIGEEKAGPRRNSLCRSDGMMDSQAGAGEGSQYSSPSPIPDADIFASCSLGRSDDTYSAPTPIPDAPLSTQGSLDATFSAVAGPSPQTPSDQMSAYTQESLNTLMDQAAAAASATAAAAEAALPSEAQVATSNDLGSSGGGLLSPSGCAPPIKADAASSSASQADASPNPAFLFVPSPTSPTLLLPVQPGAPFGSPNKPPRPSLALSLHEAHSQAVQQGVALYGILPACALPLPLSPRLQLGAAVSARLRHVHGTDGASSTPAVDLPLSALRQIPGLAPAGVSARFRRASIGPLPQNLLGSGSGSLADEGCGGLAGPFSPRAPLLPSDSSFGHPARSASCTRRRASMPVVPGEQAPGLLPPALMETLGSLHTSHNHAIGPTANGSDGLHPQSASPQKARALRALPVGFRPRMPPKQPGEQFQADTQSLCIGAPLSDDPPGLQGLTSRSCGSHQHQHTSPPAHLTGRKSARGPTTGYAGGPTPVASHAPEAFQSLSDGLTARGLPAQLARGSAAARGPGSSLLGFSVDAGSSLGALAASAADAAAGRDAGSKGLTRYSMDSLSMHTQMQREASARRWVAAAPRSQAWPTANGHNDGSLLGSPLRLRVVSAEEQQASGTSSGEGSPGPSSPSRRAGAYSSRPARRASLDMGGYGGAVAIRAAATAELAAASNGGGGGGAGGGSILDSPTRSQQQQQQQQQYQQGSPRGVHLSPLP